MNSRYPDLFENLPGAEMMLLGLADWEAGRVTKERCLVGIARPILAEAGVIVRDAPRDEDEEMVLYRLLEAEGGDAYSKYNSLLRRLVSFERTLSARVRHMAAGQSRPGFQAGRT